MAIDVNVSMEIEDDEFRYSQRTENRQRNLVYNYKKCNGCGICVDICPKQAIELGPVKEIATGLDAPPIIINQDECSFCGMCASFCPVGAIELRVTDDEYQDAPIQDADEYPHLDGHTNINDEKCLPCLLCEKTCPTGAITVKFDIPNKETISPYQENKEGSIKIDMDKCNFCGVCAKFCDAFTMLEHEKDRDNLPPFEDVLIDIDKCDYCKLCEDMCPEDAITIEGEHVDADAPEIKGEVLIDEKLCINCGRCKMICPYDAVEVEKSFEGKIRTIEFCMQQCDPQGCKACFDICPTDAWYIPPDHKIDVETDACIYCGACGNACPKDAIRVKRESVLHTPVKEGMPWTESWNGAIRSIITGERKRPVTSRAIPMVGEDLGKVEVEDYKPPEVDPRLIRISQERMNMILPLICSIKSRYIWERQQPEIAAKSLIRRMRKNLQR